MRVSEETIQRLFEAKSVANALARAEAHVGHLRAAEKTEVFRVIERAFGDVDNISDAAARRIRTGLG
jgi:hypothetical protein